MKKKIPQFKLQKPCQTQKTRQSFKLIKQVKYKEKLMPKPYSFQECIILKQKTKGTNNSQIKNKRQKNEVQCQQISNSKKINEKIQSKRLTINLSEQMNQQKHIDLKKHKQIKYKAPFNPFEQILMQAQSNNSCIQIRNHFLDSQFSNIQVKSPTFSDIFNSIKSQNDQLKYFLADNSSKNGTIQNCQQIQSHQVKFKEEQQLKQIKLNKVISSKNLQKSSKKPEIWDKIKQFNFKISQILIQNDNQSEVRQSEISHIKKSFHRKELTNLEKELDQIYKGKFKLHKH